MELDDGARGIRQRMAGLRREISLDAQKLEADVHSVGQTARDLVDWRFYVQRFPFAAIAAATAIGYLIIPKKPQVIVPDADTLAKMAKNNQVWVKTGRSKAVEKERGMVGGLVALALTAAGRMALNWATEQVKQQMSVKPQSNGSGETDAASGSDARPRTSAYPPR